MKIIELLNKIANGEEVPKKIKYEDEVFQFTGYNSASKNYNNELEDLFQVLDGSMLNDEVEIIEEDKKIEKFFTYYDDILEEYIVETKINGNRLKEHFGSPYEQMVLDKINEIIDYINNKD